MPYHISPPQGEIESHRTASLALTDLFKRTAKAENPAEIKLITPIGSIYVFVNNTLRNTNAYPDPEIDKA